MPLIGGFRFESPTLMSLFDLLFLEARAEIRKQFRWVFGSNEQENLLSKLSDL